MKRLLSLALCIVGLSAWAQADTAGRQHNSFPLMNAKAIVLTNLLCVTNLASPFHASGTNEVGTVFTNLFGTKVTSTAVLAQSFNLLSEVELPATYLVASNTTPASLGTVFIGYKAAGASATNQIVLRFVAVPDGTTEAKDSVYDVVIAADASRATTPLTYRQIIPATPFIGCKKMRLREVYYVATAAGDSRITLLNLSFNGWY